MRYGRALLLWLLVALAWVSPAAATNYITAVGSQQFTITIAAGNLTGTATISAVGSGAFTIWQGQTPSDTAAQLDDTGAYLTISGTTITATRGVTGTSQTIIINGVIVDGDTTNLIKSVQTGTVSLVGNGSATSATASISAVTNTNTAIVMLGAGYSSTITNDGKNPIISLSGTTVTMSTVSAPAVGLTVTGAFCVIEFQGTALNSSTQNVAYNATINATSATSTISSVTTGNTWLGWGGWHNSSFANAPHDGRPNIQLTNGTTITYTWNTSVASSTRQFNTVVVELKAGVLNQSVQRGTISLSAAHSNTATITSSVVANGFVNWLFNNTSQTATKPEVTDYKITQTDNTTLTMTADSAATATGVGSYETVEFPAFSGGGGGSPGNSLNAVWFGSEF